MNWHELFVPSASLAELVVRGSVVYLGLFFLLRVLRREAGSVGVTDLLFIVLIGTAVNNALVSDQKSVTEGFILVLTLAFWNYLFNWLSHTFPAIEKLLRPRPLRLITEGKMIRSNMRKEMLTEGELMSLLRKKGIEHIEDVKQCHLEPDGELSLIDHKSG